MYQRPRLSVTIKLFMGTEGTIGKLPGQNICSGRYLGRYSNGKNLQYKPKGRLRWGHLLSVSWPGQLIFCPALACIVVVSCWWDFNSEVKCFRDNTNRWRSYWRLNIRFRTPIDRSSNCSHRPGIPKCRHSSSPIAISHPASFSFLDGIVFFRNCYDSVHVSCYLF